MSFYNALIKCSESHLKLKKCESKNQGYSDNFRFDFKNKTITNGSVVIMEHGKILCSNIILSNGQIFDITGPTITNDDTKWLAEQFGCTFEPYEIVKVLYENYKFSVPSKHTVRGCNFKSIDEDELTLQQHIQGMKRETALYLLEGFIMFGSIENLFIWKNPLHYYVKLSNNLFLFRDWIKN